MRTAHRTNSGESGDGGRTIWRPTSTDPVEDEVVHCEAVSQWAKQYECKANLEEQLSFNAQARGEGRWQSHMRDYTHVLHEVLAGVGFLVEWF